ncbi:MAG: DNA alkylation repair protein [Deltaproteobacteria bacterium]|nr:DNA alkylation repair protein [Deltaproteobacteria bacterium]
MKWDVGAAVSELDGGLRALADEGRAVQEKRYLKSALVHLGITVPALRREARRFAGAHPELGVPELRRLVRALWETGVYEHRAAAVELLELRQPLLGPEDLELLEALIRASGTWALVDNLAASVTGRLVERHPSLHARLDRWSADGDFWVRRSALLAHLLPLRSGGGDFERFSAYADAMLDEREFFIRKAIGWVLRETGKKRPELVLEWLLPRASRAAGLTVREAVRYLPPAAQAAVLAARKSPAESRLEGAR